MRKSLLHLLELDDCLHEQAIPAPPGPDGDREPRGEGREAAVRLRRNHRLELHPLGGLATVIEPGRHRRGRRWFEGAGTSDERRKGQHRMRGIPPPPPNYAKPAPIPPSRSPPGRSPQTCPPFRSTLMRSIAPSVPTTALPARHQGREQVLERPIIDAGPALNFLSINKERLLISVLGKLGAPASGLPLPPGPGSVEEADPDVDRGASGRSDASC
ncbi:hypothetical protein OWR29_10435 [Actinoplanes sp. Pm04-4]|uniref:Uncharacterized protein n=1 Tax=Paractinoplanes pyxinae TaxID=2997416 RepID=A0ABT4AW08_9ACTN|nr:hypothetical protein [Actinoplanes pyxinae]MCY1138414.1 hypothetical protein [Actinoplanes pyxinae]